MIFNFLIILLLVRLIEALNPNEKYLKMYEVSLNIFLNSPLFGEGLFSTEIFVIIKSFTTMVTGINPTGF